MSKKEKEVVALSCQLNDLMLLNGNMKKERRALHEGAQTKLDHVNNCLKDLEAKLSKTVKKLEISLHGKEEAERSEKKMQTYSRELLEENAWLKRKLEETKQVGF